LRADGITAQEVIARARTMEWPTGGDAPVPL
jgi:hypothetical protein